MSLEPLANGARRATPARLPREQRALPSLLEALPEPALAVDSGGLVISLNSPARRLLDLESTDRIVGCPAGELLTFDETAAPTTRRFSNDSAWTASAHTRAGAVITVTCSPLRGRKDRAKGHVLVLRDMAQRIDYERLTTSFLSNVSHELRTPLTPMKGYARLLNDDRVSTDSVRAFASAIVDSCDRLARVVDVLVAVAHLDAGRVERKQVDLATLVREASDRCADRFPDRLFDTSIESDEGGVDADSGLLSLALDQLIDNAVKFSPPSAVVTIALRRRAGSAEVVVIDGGIGIAPEHRDTIFADFHQIDGSSTRVHGGLGLGLALVRRVASAQGGRVEVRSALGKGSTFTLSLPVRVTHPGAAVAGGLTRLPRAEISNSHESCIENRVSMDSRNRLMGDLVIPLPGNGEPRVRTSTSIPRPAGRPAQRRNVARLAVAAALVLVAGSAWMRIAKAGHPSVQPGIALEHGDAHLTEPSSKRPSPVVEKESVPSTRSRVVPGRTQNSQSDGFKVLDPCAMLDEGEVRDSLGEDSRVACATNPQVVERPLANTHVIEGAITT